MSSPVRLWIAVVCLAPFAFVSAPAQIMPPAGAAPGPAPRTPPPPPSNLKVLPKDISRADLIKYMREYEGALGVECTFCHAQNAQTKRTDFASDANPAKDTARYMITMTADLNSKYLENLPGGRMTADPITCGTCHQGHAHPMPFVPAPEAARPGAPAAAPAVTPK